ncbi:NAD(P)/FAD-dependent oxidoreductase [Halovivax cerinus]|uniref:NAD(P)/FAD-dependent oxidoreductase n=1 Tax=Halovivax cerinus TaxID=1487865 RepID=A0ABD5NJL8_9EURY|nr:FAD-dependent oxidoreductase [Halovivax cerinus]
MHVAVLGAGYAGLAVARRLEHLLPTACEVTIVADSPDHIVRHELHRVIRRPTVANDIAVSLPSVLDRARVRVSTVERVDREQRVVHLSRGSLEYDYCVICLGTETAFHGLDDVRERATPLKRFSHAFVIRRDVLETIDSTTGAVRVVVCGAGLSGVQVAGELTALAAERGVDDRVAVTLLEQRDRVAPGFPEPFGDAIERALTDAGVDVVTGTRVTGADEASLRVSGTDEASVTVSGDDAVRFDQLVWTGGIRGPDALDGDRTPVGPDLRLDAHAFGCGDAVTVTDANGATVPASAQSARREARVAAANVATLVERDLMGRAAAEPALRRFRFASPGWVVSVGDDAVAWIGSQVLTGTSARAAKATVGATYLAKLGERRRALSLLRTELGADVGGSNDT